MINSLINLSEYMRESFMNFILVNWIVFIAVASIAVIALSVMSSISGVVAARSKSKELVYKELYEIMVYGNEIDE